jgi:hypothetical protein
VVAVNGQGTEKKTWSTSTMKERGDDTQERPNMSKQEVTTADMPRRWPKAAGDEREVAPCGWNLILKYLQKCH